MRYSEARAQWEHTDEEEALHGFALARRDELPPSLVAEFDMMETRIDKKQAVIDEARARLATAEALLREGGGGMACIATRRSDPNDGTASYCHKRHGRVCLYCRIRAFLSPAKPGEP